MGKCIDMGTYDPINSDWTLVLTSEHWNVR
jgi:hypothetical protein